VSNPYPREYATLEPDLDRLSRVAAATNGLFAPKPADVFDPAGEKIVYREPLWNRVLLASIVLFLLDLLVRRVRLFDRKFVARPKKA
jgi:hypothetical protein